MNLTEPKKNGLMVSTPLKNLNVSWDYYSQYMENKSHVPNHQPENGLDLLFLKLEELE